MEWKFSDMPVPYEEAVAFMESRVQRIIEGKADEMIWLLEHPPLYTAGTSATGSDLLDACFPVYQTGRGGQYTYHGPGQRIAYVMLDLRKRGQDLRRFVQQLEQWIILTLKAFGVEGLIREGRVGVWVEHTPSGNGRGGAFHDDLAGDILRRQNGGKRSPLMTEAKIAALGVRVSKWVTYHGIAINLSPDLSHYAGIVPCGITEFGVTSLKALGAPHSMQAVDAALKRTFTQVF